MGFEGLGIVEDRCEGFDGGGVVDEFVGDGHHVGEGCAWCGGGDEADECQDEKYELRQRSSQRHGGK